jgi:uncharacterized protein with NAD-binding domain and iron-sulfur cluster
MDEIRFQDPQGPEAVYGVNPLRSPLKTVLSFLGQNRFLGLMDKLALIPITARGLRSMEGLQADYDHITVAQWWAEAGGTDDVMERFLRPFCRAIQFTDAEEFSAYNFLGWLHNVAYDLPHSLAGGYRGARDEIIFQPLGRYLTARGATIHTGARLREIRYETEANRVEGLVLESGERLHADAYVVAVPCWEFARLMPEGLRQQGFFRSIAELPVAPAISVQIWFDREVVDTPAFTLVGRSMTPVYQEQSSNAYPWEGGSRISTTISPADAYLTWTDDELLRLAVAELTRAQPSVGRAEIVKSVVLKHPKHLVKPLPGAMSARPGQFTPVPNLFLAGDWTQQDYFGSQEGAVRGGRACAEAVLRLVE